MLRALAPRACSCCIPTLPPVLTTTLAPQLETLSLGDNALSELPASVGNLTRLRQLLVCHNKLRRLPEELGNCAALEELDVHHNAVEVRGPAPGGAAAHANGCAGNCPAPTCQLSYFPFVV